MQPVPIHSFEGCESTICMRLIVLEKCAGKKIGASLATGTSRGASVVDPLETIICRWLRYIFLRDGRREWKLVTHKKLKSGRLMPWGKGTVVIGAKGFVYLWGNTATADDYDPTSKKEGGFVGDAAAQWRAVLTNTKSDLEELGSALEYLIRVTIFVKGPFPNGGVLSSPNFRLDVMDEFFAEHCPKHCSYNNPPPSEVIGVAALAQPDIVVEIVAVAALPD